MVQLNSGTDTDLALNDAQRKVNAILKDLPEDADPPSLVKFSLDDLPVVTIAATANMNETDFSICWMTKFNPCFQESPVWHR